MSTSAERVLRHGTSMRLRPVPYDDPVAQEMVEAVQQEYVLRYGGRDEAVVDPAEFLPPAGLFVLAELDGAPAGCGAWRVHPRGGVEIKRVYVATGFRRRGLAQAIMAELEASAARAGHRSAVLNTGRKQPEAVTLYVHLGYVPVPGYGRYACAPEAVFLGKALAEPTHGEESTWAS